MPASASPGRLPRSPPSQPPLSSSRPAPRSKRAKKPDRPSPRTTSDSSSRPTPAEDPTSRRAHSPRSSRRSSTSASSPRTCPVLPARSRWSTWAHRTPTATSSDSPPSRSPCSTRRRARTCSRRTSICSARSCSPRAWSRSARTAASRPSKISSPRRSPARSRWRTPEQASIWEAATVGLGAATDADFTPVPYDGGSDRRRRGRLR